MRNTTSQIDLLLSKRTEDLGNVFFGLALTSFGTGQCATEVERERVYTNALIARHDAEQYAPPAAQFGQVVSGLDDFRIPGTVNGDIG